MKSPFTLQWAGKAVQTEHVVWHGQHVVCIYTNFEFDAIKKQFLARGKFIYLFIFSNLVFSKLNILIYR